MYKAIKGRTDARITRIGLLPDPNGITTMTQKRSNGKARAAGRRRALQLPLYRETVARPSKGGNDVMLLAVATDTKREALARSLSPYLAYASRLVLDRE
jgi:hypothetical protein